MAEPSTGLANDDLGLLEQASDGYNKLREQIGRAIIGQEHVVRSLLAATFCEGHVLLIGVPGLAKTMLVKTLAEVLGWNWRRIQFTPDMMPADIVGMELLADDPETGRRGMSFVPGPIFANIILADEINRTPPKTQSALLEAMQEYQVTSMGKVHPIAKPFIVVATQNPIEQEGTYPLPEAQLDRFMFSLWIDYPTVEEEEQIVAETTTPRRITLEQVFTQSQMVAFQELVRRVPTSQHVISYAVALARATRPGSAASSDTARDFVDWGAGPRAAQHMVLAGKALAVLDGQPTVSCEHIRQAAPLVLRHRVLPNYNASGEGLSARDLVGRIINEIREPAHA